MKNPFPATVVGVRSVTKPGSAKETIHVDYSLEGSGMNYITGDALGVIPCNDPALVDALISTLGLDPTAEIPTATGTATLKEVLTTSCDITNLKKAVLNKWNAVANSPKLTAILEDKDAPSRNP